MGQNSLQHTLEILSELLQFKQYCVKGDRALTLGNMRKFLTKINDIENLIKHEV